jgi:hypothetical protein
MTDKIRMEAVVANLTRYAVIRPAEYRQTAEDIED